MPENDDEKRYLLEMLQSLGEQITALTTTVRVLIETHPDRAAVDAALERQMFRLDALLTPSNVPDASISRLRALLQDMRTVAQRRPG